MADHPILPWPEAVVWRHAARAPGAGLGPEVRPVFGWLARVEVRRAFEYREHRHADHELIAVRSGTYRCDLDGELVTVPAESLLVVSPGQRHRDRLAPLLDYLGLSFGLEGPPLIGPGQPAAARIVRGDARMRAVLDALADDPARGDRVGARIQDALLAELLWRVVRALPPTALDPEFVRRLDAESFPARFARACEARLGRPTTLAELARATGLGPSALVAACRRQLGTTPMAALAAARLARARELLAAGGHEVKRVAALCGFASPFHFSRAYRRRYGHPPSDERPDARSGSGGGSEGT